jgi:catechol 2,3-dioxygenase-like lactoylglutathione lyase family enzyme
VDFAFVQTPDRSGRLELIEFRAPAHDGDEGPAPSNAPGIRHVAFVVDDIDDVVARLQARGSQLVGEVEDYRDVFRLCYIRGPQGIIVELAQRMG